VSRRAISLAFALILLEAAGAVAIILTSDHEHHKIATTAIAVPAGISFVISGLIALRRRAENRTGLYLAGTGYLWLLAALGEANSNVIWTAGVFVANLAFISFAGLLLAFPTGQLKRRPDRLIVRATAAFVLSGPPLLLLFASRPPSCGSSCGESAIVVYRSHSIASIVDAADSVVVAALVLSVVIVLVRRWRHASSALRRVLLPVYTAAAAALAVLMTSNLLTPISTGAARAIGAAFVPLFAAVPIAFLFGLLRSRLARASVGQLVLSIGRGTPVRDAIADALGDPSVELAYSVGEGRQLVDADGRPFALPGEGSGRAATTVERDGLRVGAIVHEESLLEERELLESVAATAALALDHERLAAELRSQYGLLRTIVNTVPSLLVTVDLEGRITNLNAATVEASGYADEDGVRGRFFWDVFIDPAEREAMIERFRAAAPVHPPAEYENVFTNARGEWRVIAWRSAPVHDQSGDVAHIVAGGLDVTERKLHEKELHASRARLVAAGDEARRRLERNLHDGAQQRLVSLSLALRLAQRKIARDPQGATKILDDASGELAQALEELRELARGIHPAVLTDRGLEAALNSLAERTPLRIEVSTVSGRLPGSVEAAAYYIVSEAVANVVKHAHASTVEVRVGTPNGRVLVEVTDDGVGGADPAGGSGLRGLADRVAVLDGTLWVEAPTDGGTRVVAEIPLPA
jgi:PAS domain S-box-containing protein